MRTRILRGLCCVTLSAMIFLNGCGKVSETPNTSHPELTIAVQEQIPTAFVGKPYKLASLITEEEGIAYEYSASYIDPKSGETKKLNIRSGAITPKAEADISVTVTATCEGVSVSREVLIPIQVSADAVDQFLAAAKFENVTVAITKDSKYLHNELSTSALEITFSDPGANLMDLSHYALHSYYSARQWCNAAVTFHVFNPMEQDVCFKLESYNPETGITLLWDTPENTQLQIAKAGQWTTVAFSLYDMGITQPLINIPEQNTEAILKVLAQYDGSGTAKIYVDGVDVVPAESVEGLSTSYVHSPVPHGDWSDLLNSCKAYTDDPIAQLTKSTNGNGSKDAIRFGADQMAGYPVYYLDFPKATDISGFDYLKFDVLSENCYPYVTASVRYLDEAGEVKSLGASFDFPRDQWRTLYLNLHSLQDANLTQVVGISFTIHLDSKFQSNYFNCLYFDNISLYSYPENSPAMAPAITEDSDILSAPVYVTGLKPNSMGICKVATDETGTKKSNSTVLFWANTPVGYPTANFVFEDEQDWSDYSVLTFETHQVNAHYWMQFTIVYLDENDCQQTLVWHHDTVFNHWLTTNAPLNWFHSESGESATEEQLKRVVGFRICVDFKNNLTDELGYIFFDNFELT